MSPVDLKSKPLSRFGIECRMSATSQQILTLLLQQMTHSVVACNPNSHFITENGARKASGFREGNNNLVAYGKGEQRIVAYGKSEHTE